MKMPSRRTLLFSVLGTLILYLVGWGDYLSGFQLDFTIFYFIPIALWAWHIGIGAGLLMSLASTGGWLANDFLNHHRYTQELFRYDNAGIHLLSFTLIAVVIYLLHKRSARENSLSVHLQSAMAELHESTAEVQRLRGQSLSFCPVTHKIKAGDQWFDPVDFLKEKLDMPVNAHVSEAAVNQMMERISEYHDSHEAA